MSSASKHPFDLYVRKHTEFVYKLAYRFARSDEARAEDLAQDVFAKVWRLRARYPYEQMPKAWLGKLALRTFIDNARKRDSLVLGMDDAVSLLSSPARGDAAIVAARLRDAVARLPVSQADTVILCVYLGYTRAEAAKTLGVPEATVKSRLRYARSKLLRSVRGLRSAGHAVAVAVLLLSSGGPR